MSRRRAGGRVVTAVALTAVSAAVLGGGLAFAARQQLDGLRRTDAVAAVLSDPADGPVVNYLLVGSDSRAGADPTDADFAGIGDEATTTGQRSDTIMVLRHDRATGGLSLVSLPRDLWLEIAGTGSSNRINAAYAKGADVLVQTVQQSLGIPIHHYLEVDFQGFKQIVDAVGGVTLCFDTAVRDEHTGLFIPDPGCYVLDGVQSLQYARSRYHERFVDGEWRMDGTADIGRTQRQQAFVEAAVGTAVDAVAANPFRAGVLADAVIGALLVDEDLSPVELARRLRPVTGGGLARYALPVRGETIDGKSVLLLADGALEVIAHFQGGPPPPAA